MLAGSRILDAEVDATFEQDIVQQKLNGQHILVSAIGNVKGRIPGGTHF